ncbi:D-alanyl-D-alanine carboxypeptidase family protein [Petroclostridium xylanilyticum]|uniref:D-alanyl-D-alanine carboxypeptidase family protein n=1 Tax=Petroclostridium xylanilyticum TaxID=1792311 RepID=UPI001FA8817E|nr:D-alanyl-D-alanine carboxypeptidase family protein [Petroclostridium xylanilyticum]
MKRLFKLISLVCVILLLFNYSAFAKAEPANDLNIQAKSAVLMEASTGKILYEQNSHEKLPPASVTKVMTMLLIMEAIDNGKISFDDMVASSEYAASMGGSQIYLEPGEQMSVHDMLKAIAVASGNDASVAMAEHIYGSEEAFVKAMNDKAKELGMNDTNFVNCNGLDADNHYTSAYDIALMSRELLKHPKIHDYLTIWIDSLRDGKFGLANTNKLIRFYPGANGIKTGSTGKALYCLSASAKRDGMQLIAVIMAAPNTKERFNAATKLLDYGFANYSIVSGAKKGELVGELDVLKGITNKVNLVAASDFNALIKKGQQGNIDKKVNIADNLHAPVEKGQKVGEIVFSAGGEEVGKVDVITSEAVEKVSVDKVFIKLVKHWLNARK